MRTRTRPDFFGAGLLRRRPPLDSTPATKAASRRIWETDPSLLIAVVGVLLRREKLEQVFANSEREDVRCIREDILLLDAIQRCKCPSAFAEAIERALDQQTQTLRDVLRRCSMIHLAEWWAAYSQEAAGEHLAAFLWSLAGDQRPEIGALTARVLGSAWVRALHLLSGHQTRGSLDAAERLFQLR